MFDLLDMKRQRSLSSGQDMVDVDVAVCLLNGDVIQMVQINRNATAADLRQMVQIPRMARTVVVSSRMCSDGDYLFREHELGAELQHVVIKLNEAFGDKASLRAALEVIDSGTNEEIEGLIDRYGEVSDWDVSAITDMSRLCSSLEQFNEPIGD